MRKADGLSRIHTLSRASFREHAAHQAQRRQKMTRLALTENRLPDPTLGAHSNRANASPHSYRFGRISGKQARSYAGRAVRSARGFFGAMLEIFVAAKMRRIERELRVRGVHRGSVRLDGDRFSVDADQTSTS
jgi:hypothetical protein